MPKYIAFYRCSNFNGAEMEWFENVQFEKTTKFYLVEAKNESEARKKLFLKLYDDYKSDYVTAEGVCYQEISEEETIEKFGEKDGRIISKGYDYYLDEPNKTFNPYKIISEYGASELSERSIKILSEEVFANDMIINQVIEIK